MENWCGQRELDIAVDEHCTGAVHSVRTAKEDDNFDSNKLHL